MKYRAFFVILFALTGNLSFSQSTLGETVRDHLVKEWEMAKAMTNQYLNTMPADKYEFKAHDSIRSFAQQMLHLAQVTNAMISQGTGAARIFPRQRRLDLSPSAQVKDSVFYYVNASYDFAIQAIKNMDITKLEEIVKERRLELTRLAWLLKAFDHQTHHRGQTTIYIRLAGLKPPAWQE